MRRHRLPLFLIGMSLALVVLVGTRGRGQSGDVRDYVVGLGLPGIDRGVIAGEAQGPSSAATRARNRPASRAPAPDRVGRDGSRRIAGRLIVKFREGLPSAERQRAVADASPGATLVAAPAYADFDLVRIDPAEDPERVARILATRADVEYAQPSHRFHTQFVPNDPLYRTLQWNLPLIDMERAWDIQAQAGSTITVAVIDTGVAYANATLVATIPAFSLDGVLYPRLGVQTIPFSAAPQLAPASRFVSPKTFLTSCATGQCVSVCADDPPLDTDGHGTHVSGTVGQTTNDGVGTAGVAFNVKIMPVKVLSGVWDVLTGCGDDIGGFEDDVARGIRYAADNGAQIINLSLGAQGDAGSAPAVEDAMKYAVNKGVFIAVAGGNDYEDGNPTEVIAEIASRLKGAVSVAAVDPRRSRAYYSSTGTYIELAAPGGSSRGFGTGGAVFQQTFDPDYADTFLLPPLQFTAPRFDTFAYVPHEGTSMATPHVSAVAALLMQQGITSPAAVEDALERFAVDLGAPGRDAEYRLRAHRSAQRPARTGRHPMRMLAGVLVALALTTPARAQTAAGAPVEPSISVRPFFLAAGEQFAARQTFEAVFGFRRVVGVLGRRRAGRFSRGPVRRNLRVAFLEHRGAGVRL